MATDTTPIYPSGISSVRTPDPTFSTIDDPSYSTIKWRAVFAGVFVGLLSYMIFMSLGLALGGANLDNLIRGDTSGGGFGIGAGIWIVVSVLFSLFIGSYAAGRVSGLISNRVGRTQGVVITALFFAFVLSQVGSAIGTLGRGIGNAAGALGGAAGDLSQNAQVQDLVDDAIGDLNLKSSPEVVAKGVASRLIRGNPDSAVNYLSRQAGISPNEARTRLDSLRQDVDRTLTDAGMRAANVIQAAGWTLFGALVLGMLAGAFGGGLGAQANLRHPLDRSDRKAIDKRRAA